MQIQCLYGIFDPSKHIILLRIWEKINEFSGVGGWGPLFRKSKQKTFLFMNAFPNKDVLGGVFDPTCENCYLGLFHWFLLRFCETQPPASIG